MALSVKKGLFFLLWKVLLWKGAEEMRVDKFLKVSRIIKRRTIANEACDAGRVMINGKVVKAGAEVKIGDIIEIQFGNNTTKIEVLDLKESTKKEDAVNMYKSL